MNDRIKKIIFDKLLNDMKGTEIIVDDDDIWAIDPDEKYWYFQLEKDGTLWWRWEFFNNFFRLFSMQQKEYEPLIRDMVEDILNRKVGTSNHRHRMLCRSVEDILNRKVGTSGRYYGMDRDTVEDILNRKVDTSTGSIEVAKVLVEEIFNRKVKTTVFDEVPPEGLVEIILNRKVNKI